MKKDKHIYFPIVKLKRTRFNTDKSYFEEMDISPTSFRIWKHIFTTPELITQLEEKTRDHN